MLKIFKESSKNFENVWRMFAESSRIFLLGKVLFYSFTIELQCSSFWYEIFCWFCVNLFIKYTVQHQQSYIMLLNQSLQDKIQRQIPQTTQQVGQQQALQPIIHRVFHLWVRHSICQFRSNSKWFINRYLILMHHTLGEINI